jgi:hypothetical protein
MRKKLWAKTIVTTILWRYLKGTLVIPNQSKRWDF